MAVEKIEDIPTGGYKMNRRKITMEEIVNKFGFVVVAGKEGIQREVTTSSLSRAGLVLAGYVNYYPSDRIQILGKTELSFLEQLPKGTRVERFMSMCHEDTPGIIFSRDLPIPSEFIEIGDRLKVPLLSTKGITTRVASRLTNYLESKFAPFIAMHGVLVDVYGMGVLITGNSGVGKSETALELVKRGHRLVADDSVEIYQEDEETLIGYSPDIIKHLLEIRGLGIINVMTLFGAGSVRSNKRIDLIVNLEIWNQEKNYDRLGLDEETEKIMEIEIPRVVVPVRPGRNLAIIIEVAAMNYRMKRLGVNAAQIFMNDLQEKIERDERDEQ